MILPKQCACHIGAVSARADQAAYSGPVSQMAQYTLALKLAANKINRKIIVLTLLWSPEGEIPMYTRNTMVRVEVMLWCGKMGPIPEPA